MADPLAISLGVLLTLIVTVLHYMKGTDWKTGEDISTEVLEQRANSVPETKFAEPMNRSIGGGMGATEAIGTDVSGEEFESEDSETGGFDPSAIPDEEIKYFDVEYVKQEETIEVSNDTHLLDAGEDQGWELPYSCRQGQCLSCCARILDGPAQDYIRHSNNEVLSEEEMEQGYCLTCVAYPVDTFRLETHEKP